MGRRPAKSQNGVFAGKAKATGKVSTVSVGKGAVPPKSHLLKSRKVEVKARRRKQIEEEASRPKPSQPLVQSRPIEAPEDSGLGGSSYAATVMMNKRRSRKLHLKHVGGMYEKKVRDNYNEEIAEAEEADALVRQEDDPLGMYDEIDEEEDEAALESIRNANEVWMEIQRLDARFNQLQRQQNSGSTSADRGNGICSSISWLCFMLRQPFAECYRTARDAVMETEAMQKMLILKGYKVYGTDPRVDLHRADFEGLLLQESDVGFLFKLFKEIDSDNSGEVSMTELLNFLELPRTPFTKTVFTIMDEDKSGQIDFREFVVASWNYCTLSKGALVMFAFDLYDRDHSGVMDRSEVQCLLKDVYGKDFAHALQAQYILKRLQALSDAENQTDIGMYIDHAAFFEFCQHYPGLLYPAFNLQHQIRTKILGERFWLLKAGARLFLSDGKYISAGKLIQLHLERTAMKSFSSKYKDFEDQRPVKEVLLQTGILKMRQASRGLGDASFAAREVEVRRKRQKFQEVLRKAKNNWSANAEARDASQAGNSERTSNSDSDEQQGSEDGSELSILENANTSLSRKVASRQKQKKNARSGGRGGSQAAPAQEKQPRKVTVTRGGWV